MKYEQIEEIIQKRRSPDQVYEIKFRTRHPIKGLFIEASDYRELSRKNLWRIVSEGSIEQYKAKRDENMARIFNGIDFTGLEAKS